MIKKTVKLVKKNIAILLALLMIFTSFISIPAVPAMAATTNYYVDESNGNDANNGQSPSTAFKTIQKAADVAVSGDTVNILAGVYREDVTPKADNVTYTNYQGANVTISGCNLITGWTPDTDTNYSSLGVYVAPMNWDMYNGAGNIIFSDGQLMKEASWPDIPVSGLLTKTNYEKYTTVVPTPVTGPMTSFNDNNLKNAVFADNALAGAMLWTVSGNGYSSLTAAITGNTSTVTTGTVTINWPFTATGYNPTIGNSVYYITRIKAVLNTATEWYKDVTNQKLYFITPDKSDPNGHVVEAKARDYAFELSGRSNVTIKGINLRAAGVNFANSHYCTLQGADVQAVDNNEPVGINYNEGYTKGLTLDGDHNTIRDCEVHNMYGAGIVFSGHDNNAINNYVHDVDFNHNYADGIRIFGYNQLISNNTISNCARAGIGGTFTSSVIQYNDINNCMKLSSDGGAVYLVDSDYGGSEIHNNIVHDIASPGGLGGSGIYTDNSTHNLAIYNNIVYNCAGTSAALENGPNEYQLWENNTIKGNVTEYTNPGPLDYVDSTGTKVINEIAGGTEATNSTEVTSKNLANFPATGWKAPTATPPDFSLTATSPALGKGKVIPGVTDGYTGAAPNIGAVGNGPDWTKSVGCNLSNPSSVNAAFQLNSSIPYKNLVKNPGFEQGNGPKDLGLTGAGFAGPGSLAGWTVDSGSPYINTQNAWDYKITSLNRFNSNSAVLPAGAKIEQTITGLKPNTSYTMTSWGRINGKLYQAENADAKSNASDFDTLNYRVETGLTNVNSVSAAPFPYLEFDNINFGVPGDLDNSISIGTYGKTTASTIEVHLDSPTGTLMSNFNGATYQSKTTQWMYTDFTLTGVPTDGANHKLYFVFKGAGKSGYLDGFKLYNSAPPTTEDITFGVTGYGGHDLTATVTGTNGVGYVNSSGQLQQKTIKFVTGPNSTSATIYASKAGGSLLGYVDAFGLAEDILQDPFGPGSTLTQYKDGFEDPTFSSWSWGYGAPALSSTVFNEGIHSYQVGGQDQGAIYKVFGSTYSKVATIDFYDNFSYNNNISAHVDQSGSTNFGNQSSMYGMGVITANSIQNYSYNLGSTTWKTSSVKRTKGWHTLTFDYSSGKGLNMYIDNTLVASTSSITGFNTIAMGDFFADGIQGKGYFDNVRITNGLLISPSGATLPQITAPSSLTVGTETISDTTAAVNLSVSAASSIPNAANPVALSMTVDGTTPFSSGSKLSTGFHTITVKADDTSNGGSIAIKNIWINVVQTAVFDNFESYTGSILSGSTWVDGSNTAGHQTPSVATSGSYDGNRAFKYQASSTANATNANIDAMKLASGIPTGGLMGKTVSVWFYDPYNTSAKRVDQVLAIYGANNTFFLGTAYDAASGTTNGSSDYYCFRSTALGTTYGTKFLPINNTTAGLPVTVGLIPRSTGWHQFKIDFSTTATDGNVNLYVDNQLLYTSPNNQNDSLFLNGGSSGQIALGSFWTNGMDTTPTYYWDNFKITGLADTAGPSITASGNTSTYLNGSNGVTIDSGINFSDVDTAAIPATAEVQKALCRQRIYCPSLVMQIPAI
ncbi:right-handed parallel beta-helix repeat-containing protein [Neobacillus massiliamazoniensis]|uniref:CBM6 domain-containing protein n=1 Tax=Neobacillus massiliamazoniensis TaxID=1499688 RepID=A0A0U1NQF5_9BACI|nr:right-handed parallel beta-helix repeat-containing protein [Neobacillus massiliamazoniensis]CRK80257.1 hypothetical protein BN000_00138 [Neobacillus massiliamazoniensis]